MALKHPWRVLLLAAVLLVLGTGAYLLWRFGTGWTPGCLFCKWTGLECPGCGMTRATHALLEGRIIEAFAFNPVGTLLFPIAGIAVSLKAIGWARGKPLPYEVPTGRWGATAIAVVVIGWWILRNLI